MSHRRNAGFTILELALTLAILGMLAGAVLVPFVAQLRQRNISDTEKLLEDVKEALLGYAMATGRVPCPATATSNGLESFATGGGSMVNGNCAAAGATAHVGFLPAVTLGISSVDKEGFAVDAWGTTQNRIRYAVANVNINGLANTSTFTRTGGMKAATASGMATNTSLLYVCASGDGGANMTAATNCGTAIRLADNAPVVIWSVGPNAATGGTGADEAQNPNPSGGSADRIFVSRTTNQTAGNEFDDLVTWLSVGNLVSRMVMGGQLP